MIKNLKLILLIMLFVIGLAFIRLYENTWFYDPFLDYFRGDYQNSSFPEFESIPLFLNLTFRYFLNTLLSLGLIYVVFKNKEFLKVALFLYLIFFVVLITVFFMIVKFTDSGYNFMLFYLRRFLIQPLFLLLFIPAFYFQKKSKLQEK